MIVERQSTIVSSSEKEQLGLSPEEFLIDVAPKKVGVLSKHCRVVRFNEEVILHPRKDPILDLDEIKARWLQADEIKQIQQKLNQTVWLMRKGSKINEETHCAQGLEHLVNQKANRKARRLVVNSVLTEQDLQRYERIYDVELIANASREFSEEHRERSYLRALFDQHENSKTLSKILGQQNKLMELKRKSVFLPMLELDRRLQARRSVTQMPLF